MNLNTISLGDFTKLATVIWEKEQMSIPETMRNSGLVKIDMIPNHVGDTKEYSEIDLEEYATIKDEGDQADQAKVQQGYTKTATLQRIGKDIPITVEMRTRNKYPEVIARLTNLARLVRNKMDLDLTHRITFGTAVSYTDNKSRTIATTVGDGLALFSTVHTLKGSATTYRNILAGNPQVSKGALESIEKLAVEQTYNQFGELLTQDFDIIWSGPDPNTVNTIRELLQSSAEISSPNAGVINTYQGKYKHVILKRLATTATGAPDTTKAKYWGIASSKDTSFYVGIHEEAFMNSPAIATNAEDVSTEDWTFTARGSYMMCIVGARWLKGSLGDGSA